MNVTTPQQGYVVYTFPSIIQDSHPIQFITPPIMPNISNIISTSSSDIPATTNAKTPTKIKRYKFSEEEDTELSRLVSIYGTSDWNTISKEMHKFKPINSLTHVLRTPRQCKDRYMNYLSPDISHLDWTPEEDKFLMLQIFFHNKSWKKLKSKFPGRTEIELRNRFHHLQNGIMQEIRSEMGLRNMPNEKKRVSFFMTNTKLDLPEHLQVDLGAPKLADLEQSQLGSEGTSSLSYSEIMSNPNTVKEILSSQHIKEELSRPEHQQRISALQNEEQFFASLFKNKAMLHQAEQDFQHINDIMNDQDTLNNLF